MTRSSLDPETLAAVLDGDETAWSAFLAAYERRLAGYFRPRVPDSQTVDDLVQETMLAFWRSLANFDRERPVEPFLFAVAANKLTDWLRRQGRRPSLAVAPRDGSAVGEAVGPGRAASSLARSLERRVDEEEVLAGAVSDLIEKWRRDGAWDRVATLELTLVRSSGNVEAAAILGLSEQTVANHKSYGLRKIREEVARRGVGGTVLAGDG